MSGRSRTWVLGAVVLVTVGVGWAAQGSSAGPAMPWDAGLEALVDNLTGTVARLMIIAAIVIAGVMWAFTEHGTGGRRISQIVFGGAVALGAVSFLAALGLGGAVV